jgi:hypothetical protein
VVLGCRFFKPKILKFCMKEMMYSRSHPADGGEPPRQALAACGGGIGPSRPPPPPPPPPSAPPSDGDREDTPARADHGSRHPLSHAAPRAAALSHLSAAAPGRATGDTHPRRRRLSLWWRRAQERGSRPPARGGGVRSKRGGGDGRALDEAAAKRAAAMLIVARLEWGESSGEELLWGAMVGSSLPDRRLKLSEGLTSRGWMCPGIKKGGSLR